MTMQQGGIYVTELQTFATQIRIAQLRAFKARGFGHVGGALSATDCIAALYGGVLQNLDPKAPQNPARDRFICSKGHAGPALYAALALKGYFPEEMLETLNQPHTKLPSHCDKNLTPGIDMTTGSLGQGASLAAGMALGLKLSGNKARVYLLLGDGESNEGQVWEMALFAPAKKLGNFIAFIDYNHKQLDGTTEEILDMGDIAAKFEAFGWYTMSIDGHDPDGIAQAVGRAQKEQGDRPACIVLNTVKGGGIPEVESTVYNHHINITAEQADAYADALRAKLGR